MKDLVSTIQKLAHNFAKYHYDKYLKQHDIKKIENDDLIEVVTSLFNNEKEKELKVYIRTSLKKMCGETYNSFAVENALSEMFNDRKLIVKRICLEIQQFQKTDSTP